MSGFGSVILGVLGQLKSIPSDEPRLGASSSETLTALMGIILVVGILLISFRPSKRDRVQD